MAPTNKLGKHHLPALDAKLQESLLLNRSREGDYLQLSDAVLRAALEGSRPLSANEAAILQASPLTLRRFRHLAVAQRDKQTQWHASSGIVLAAASVEEDAILHSLDLYWQLQLLQVEKQWQVILRLRPSAPFAAQILNNHAALELLDGKGQVILRGSLDADGELELPWTWPQSPLTHFTAHGGSFHVRLQSKI